MTTPVTESINEKSEGLDAQSPEAILTTLLDGQVGAVRAVAEATGNIAEAASKMAQTVRCGANICYAAAGSSALMALADGLELPGTFGIANDRVKTLIAGGTESLTDMMGQTEDDSSQAIADVQDAGIGEQDCLICVSASGTTPYVLAALAEAKLRGATIIGLANNGDAPLLANSDIAIFLPTPPEIISGSTRLGAASAQKVALNMMSTLMAIHLGHVHDGHMVNVRADNIKLKKRAERIVRDISKCSEADARASLSKTGGSVKIAVLIAAGARNRQTAENLLDSNDQNLRLALSAIGQS